jgi:exodeoxyribonuclease V beta subunit
MIPEFHPAETELQPGTTLIEASAGTGKTYTITSLFLRLIVEQAVPIGKLLAVTFTEAATEELRDRIRQRLHEAAVALAENRPGDDEIVAKFLRDGLREVGLERLRLALQSFDEAQIFTIHGFCQRALNDFAFESGARFGAKILPDPSNLFLEVAQDFWRKRFYSEKNTLILALAECCGIRPEHWVDLLHQDSTHPGIVILPPEPSEVFEKIYSEVVNAFGQAQSAWKQGEAQVEQILRHSADLRRSAETFRTDVVTSHLEGLRGINDKLIRRDCVTAIKCLTTQAIAEGTLLHHTPPKHVFFESCQKFCDVADHFFARLTYDFLSYAREELPKRKARANVLTYDDLIGELSRALDGENGKRLAAALGDNYVAATVDEFQDTDPAQYKVFRTIFSGKEHQLYLIGDPKQAIYSFRGADIFTYLKAATEADRSFTLLTNWRCEAPLLRGINELFGHGNNPFVFEQIEYREVKTPGKPRVEAMTNDSTGGFLKIRFLEEQSSEPLNVTPASDLVRQAVAQDVRALVEGGARIGNRTVGLADVAILVRTHWEAADMHAEMARHGIRAIVRSDKSVFASPEASDLHQLLQGLLNSRRDSALKEALSTPFFGFDALKINELELNEAKRQEWLDRFVEWRRKWIDNCFIAMFRDLLVAQQVRARLMKIHGGERRVTNYLHLGELLHEAESSQRLNPDSLCSWVADQRTAKGLAEDRYQLRLEGDEDSLQIVTVHRAKGLEYPIVFCPFVWKKAERGVNKEMLRFHDHDASNQLTLDLREQDKRDPRHEQWQSEEERAEEQRLLYVALTRAKNRCYLYLPNARDINKSPLKQLFAGSNTPLFQQIRGLAERSPGSIEIRDESVAAPAPLPPTGDEAPALRAKTFNGSISRDRLIGSFSRLTSGREEGDDQDRDHLALTANEREPTDANEISIATFTRGAKAGDFFHDVLEELNFQDLNAIDGIIERKLPIYGFGQTKHRETLKELARNLVEVELQPGLRLRDIAPCERLNELEFLYPLARLTPRRLKQVFADCPLPHADIPHRLEELNFDPVSGFMRGFIDLLFQADGRYYLVDWKSNWLGHRPSDYDEAGMRESMLEHNYFFQSHLYTVATDLFLSQRLPNYSYIEHFGGVFYVFLRGVDPNKPEQGIFRDKPAPATVNKLRQLLP